MSQSLKFSRADFSFPLLSNREALRLIRMLGIESEGRSLHYCARRNYANGVYHGAGSLGASFHSRHRMTGGPRAIGTFSAGGSNGGRGFHGRV